MTARAVTAAAALAAIACRTPSESRLEGRWVGVRAEGVAADALPAADAFAKDLKLDFRGDILTATSSKGTQIGVFHVVREDGGTIVIITERDGPEHPETFVVKGETSDDESMRWLLPESGTARAIVFTRP
jgi:hypothetical protein